MSDKFNKHYVFDDSYCNEGGEEKTTKKTPEEEAANFKATDFGIDPERGFNNDRGCTDIFFLIVFFVFVASMIFLTSFAQANGNPGLMFASVDGDKRLCGYTAEHERLPEDDAAYDMTKLFITDLTFVNGKGLAGINGIFKTAVCVKECPKDDSAITEYRKTSTIKGASVEGYKSHEMVNLCAPSVEELRGEYAAGWKIVKAQILESSAGSLLNDMYLSSRAIYWSFATAPIYCFLFIFIMSKFSEIISWFIIFAVQIGLVGMTAAIFMSRAEKEKQHAENLANKVQVNVEDFNEGQTKHLWLGILFGLLSAIYLCLLCCFWKSLGAAIDAIDASADFINENKRVILVPFLYFFLSFLVIAAWMVAIVVVISLNDVEASEDIPQGKTIKWTSDFNYYAVWYMIFGLLWILNWLDCTSSFVVQVSSATYYFNSSENGEGQAEISKGFRMAYLHHLGSIAIGAFIIALIQFIKIVFVYTAQLAAKTSGENKVSQMIVKCGVCYLNYLESLCNYINRSAFAFLAVSGKSGFCGSAWHAFMLQLKHLGKFATAIFLANIFILLGKLAITMMNMYSCYLIMKFATKDLEEIGSLIGPMFVVGLFSFIAASIFMGIFELAVTTNLTCYAIDMDVNGGEDNIKWGPPTFHTYAKKAPKEKPLLDEAAKNEMA